MSSRTPSSFWSSVGLLSVAALSALGVVVGVMFGADMFRVLPPLSPPPTGGKLSTPFFVRGLQRPDAQPAASAAVPDEAEVLGVSAGGRHRAYLVTALSRIGSHVVNDVLGDVPVTVTFCDRSQCARVFTGTERSSPLPIDLGGILEDDMLLKSGDGFYHQISGKRTDGREDAPFPYPSHPFLRTSWKEWKEAHPDTDIFLGIPAGE
jgi:hypothetical protein